MAAEITLTQAAAKAKVSYPTGLRLVLVGTWRGWQVDGRRWVVDESSVLDYLRRKRTRAGAAVHAGAGGLGGDAA